MRRSNVLFMLLSSFALVHPAQGQDGQPATTTAAPASETAGSAAAVPTPASDTAGAVLGAIAALPPESSDEDRNERAAIVAFYADRGNEPLFIAETGVTPSTAAAIAEFRNAAAWGLDPAEFALPEMGVAKDGAPQLTPEQRAQAEIAFARMVQLYARYARGGRIIHPGGQLNTNLDRRPQFAKPAEVMSGFAAAEDAAAFLRGLHPRHAQFEKLRQRYLVARGNTRPVPKLAQGADLAPGNSDGQVPALRERLGLTTGTTDAQRYDDELKTAVVFFQSDRKLSRSDGVVDQETRDALNKAEPVEARRLLANMEQWRWMPANLGDLYLIANVPEFMINLYKDGEIIFTERIVAGEIGKQTTIYSRPLRHVVLRPKWRVPESIKVKELWPSLRGSGGLMVQYGLQLETKDGQPLDWRQIDWKKADIRNYEVTQPPGRRSVLGNVKFSFP